MSSASKWSRFGLTFLAVLTIVSAGCDPGGGGGGNENTNDNGNVNDNGNTNGNENTNENENENENDNGNVNGNDNTADDGSPTAAAGDDQEVASGDAVTLDGSGSSDPDGDELTYAWTQTAGTDVELTGADTAAPTFTAPGVTETLTFSLTVSDGDAETGDSTDTVDVVVTAQPSRLFVVTNNGGLLSFLNPASLDDQADPTTELETGATTGIQGQGSDMVVNGAGEIMVSASNRDAITVHSTVAASGERPFVRQVTGALTQFGDPAGIAIDIENDVVFIADKSESIFVFDGASTAAFDGDIPPDREIETGVDGFSSSRMVFYAGELYVKNGVSPYDIFVFADASTADEMTTFSRIISSDNFNSSFGTFTIDSQGRLFAASRTDSVYMWNDAGTLDGGIPPDATFTIADSTLAAVVVDSNDTMFILDSSDSLIYSIDNVSDLASGTIDPERAFEVTGLSLARQLFLLED